MKIDELQLTSFEAARDKGFHEAQEEMDPERAAVYVRVMLVVTELAEAIEELRDDRDLDEVYYVDGKPEGFPTEVADAVIRLADLAGTCGFNLNDIIEQKLDYNETREHLHGGRAA